MQSIDQNRKGPVVCAEDGKCARSASRSLACSAGALVSSLTAQDRRDVVVCRVQVRSGSVDYDVVFIWPEAREAHSPIPRAGRAHRISSIVGREIFSGDNCSNLRSARFKAQTYRSLATPSSSFASPRSAKRAFDSSSSSIISRRLLAQCRLHVRVSDQRKCRTPGMGDISVAGMKPMKYVPASNSSRIGITAISAGSFLGPGLFGGVGPLQDGLAFAADGVDIRAKQEFSEDVRGGDLEVNPDPDRPAASDEAGPDLPDAN